MRGHQQRDRVARVSRRGVRARDLVPAWLHPPTSCEARTTRAHASRHRHLRPPHQLKNGELLVIAAAWHGYDGNACSACRRPVANRDVDEWDIVQARVKALHSLRRGMEVPVHLPVHLS